MGEDRMSELRNSRALRARVEVEKDRSGLTWKALAEAAGLSTRALRAFRNGETASLREDNAKALGDALGIGLHELRRLSRIPDAQPHAPPAAAPPPAPAPAPASATPDPTRAPPAPDVAPHATPDPAPPPSAPDPPPRPGPGPPPPGPTSIRRRWAALPLLAAAVALLAVCRPGPTAPAPDLACAVPFETPPDPTEFAAAVVCGGRLYASEPTRLRLVSWDLHTGRVDVEDLDGPVRALGCDGDRVATVGYPVGRLDGQIPLPADYVHGIAVSRRGWFVASADLEHTGHRLWEVDPGGGVLTEQALPWSPVDVAALPDRLLVANGPRLHAFDADLRELGSWATPWGRALPLAAGLDGCLWRIDASATPRHVPRDGDGDGAVWAALGGRDCDDTDPTVIDDPAACNRRSAALPSVGRGLGVFASPTGVGPGDQLGVRLHLLPGHGLVATASAAGACPKDGYACDSAVLRVAPADDVGAVQPWLRGHHAGTVGTQLAHGDVDGDGRVDLVVGEGRRRLAGGGESHGVVHLLRAVSGSSRLDAPAQWRGDANDTVGLHGLELAPYDDDGLDDLVIRRSGTGRRGGVHVVVRPRDGLHRLRDTPPVVASHEDEVDFGSGGVVVTDLEADGGVDLLVASPLARPGDLREAGDIRRYRGLAPGADHDAAHHHGRARGASAYGHLGTALAVADLDGDGRPEVVVGAPDARSAAGRVRVLDRDLRTIDGVSGVPGDRLGLVVRALGDLDGDGAAEVWLGGSGPDHGGVGWLVHGGLPLSLDDAFQVRGDPGDQLGTDVAVGDVDGDGRPELALGAPRRDGPAGIATGGVTFLDLDL